MKLMKILLLCLTVLFAFSVQTTPAEAATINITMKKTSYSLYVGGKQQLAVTVKGSKPSNVKWKSSNSGLATVDSKGLVNALKVGKVSMTAYIPNTKAKAVATINISKKILNSQETFKKVNPAVVKIELFNKYNQPVSSGSGFIVHSNGTIVTNHHVVIDVSEAKYVKIHLSDGRVYQTSQVIDYSEVRDLAVLKIPNVKNLPTVELADSSKIETGEKVFALGSPLGISNTITEGIVSNKQIFLDDKQAYIQSTAPISHGNSGGVLANQYGEVIGVNAAYLVDGQNMNLAIPINDFKKLKLTQNKTLLNVNRETYVPMSGEGDVVEEEDNNDLYSADPIPFKKTWISGKTSNNDDFDLYYFNLTDKATVNIFCLTDDLELSDSLGIGLFNEDDELIEWGTEGFDEKSQSHFTSLELQLEPGTYFLQIAPYSDVTKTFSNHPYSAIVEVMTK